MDGIRITSYNVCYTKLLRRFHFALGLCYREKRMFDEAIRSHRTAVQLSGGMPVMLGWLRITSYNVCYTKLLRLIGDGPGDRLANPPGGVGAELIAPTVLEFVHRLHQAA